MFISLEWKHLSLSQFLFSLYINDKENYLVDKNIAGLQSFITSTECDLCKTLTIHFATDTVILAESVDN